MLECFEICGDRVAGAMVNYKRKIQGQNQYPATPFFARAATIVLFNIIERRIWPSECPRWL